MEIQKKTSLILIPILAIAMMLGTAQTGSAADELAAPEGFAAVKYGSYNKAKLTWKKVAGATAYRVYRATKANGKYKKVKQTKKVSFINKNLKAKGVYYYKVRAIQKTDKGTIVGPATEVQAVTVKYAITGTSRATAEDLVRYFKKSGHKFPKYYKKTDTPTLKAFCQAYVEEAAAEGIRAEVAFAQAMLETGWLRYGGDVKIKQHNFAGMGAVGGGAKGNSFSTVKKGIRAHVQHLKAYANKKALNKKCVDSRFSYVTRGTCAYVEWLGIPDNPKKCGWAASKGYGYRLVKMINAI